MQTALKIRPPCRLEEINIDVVKHNFDYLDKYPDVIVCDVAHNIPALVIYIYILYIYIYIIYIYNI